MNAHLIACVKGTMGLGIEGKWKALWNATFGYEYDAPCTHQPLRNRLGDWWSEYRPRWPKWDITVYQWHHDKPGTDEEYQFVFDHYQIPWRTARFLERELPLTYSEYPLTVRREYSWL